MPSYKLIYFNLRGRGQSLRFLCADNGITLDEEDIAYDDWPNRKKLTIFGQLPALRDGNFEIAQSSAILRYVARKHALYGKSDEEKAKIDMLNDQLEDIRTSYIRLIYEKYDTEKENYIKSLPDKLASVETFIEKNNGGKGYCVGDQINFVDYNMYDLLDILLILSPHALDKVPLLKGFHTRMSAREKIAKYRSSDRFKNMLVNYNGKQ